MDNRETRADPRGILAMIGIGLLVLVVGAVYGGHKYKMWRYRKKEEKREREDETR